MNKRQTVVRLAWSKVDVLRSMHPDHTTHRTDTKMHFVNSVSPGPNGLGFTTNPVLQTNIRMHTFFEMNHEASTELRITSLSWTLCIAAPIGELRREAWPTWSVCCPPVKLINMQPNPFESLPRLHKSWLVSEYSWCLPCLLSMLYRIVATERSIGLLVLCVRGRNYICMESNENPPVVHILLSWASIACWCAWEYELSFHTDYSFKGGWFIYLNKDLQPHC